MYELREHLSTSHSKQLESMVIKWVHLTKLPEVQAAWIECESPNFMHNSMRRLHNLICYVIYIMTC